MILLVWIQYTVIYIETMFVAFDLNVISCAFFRSVMISFYYYIYRCALLPRARLFALFVYSNLNSYHND